MKDSVTVMWSIVNRKQNKKEQLLIFSLADENQFLLRLLWEFNFRNYTNAMIDSLVELLQCSPGFDKKILNVFVFVGQFNNREILWFSKWNQSTYFKLGSVSKAYLLEDIVQKRRRVSIILDYAESSSVRNSNSERFKAFLKVDSI